MLNLLYIYCMVKGIYFKNLILFFVFITLFKSVGFAQDKTEVSVQDTTQKKKNKRLFELSLGQTLLFISDTKIEEIKKVAAITVPTNAKLFFAEFRPTKIMKIPFFLNLPTQTKQFIVDGELVYERASPTFGAGLQFRLFKLPIGVKGALELEMGPLASFLLNENNVVRFAPVAAARFRFVKNEDYIIYFGSSYSVGINVLGVLFGIGYVF